MKSAISRVTALEEALEEARLRPIREMAAENGVPFEDLRQLYEERRVWLAQQRASGKSEQEIMTMAAEHIGIGVEELTRRCEELIRRYGAPA